MIIWTFSNRFSVVILFSFKVSIITYFTCRREIDKNPVKNEITSVKAGSLNITKKFLNVLVFLLRNVIRNEEVFGIVEYCILIVCAFGMINSMNHFIKIKFDDLYFDYKLSLKGNE